MPGLPLSRPRLWPYPVLVIVVACTRPNPAFHAPVAAEAPVPGQMPDARLAQPAVEAGAPDRWSGADSVIEEASPEAGSLVGGAVTAPAGLTMRDPSRAPLVAPSRGGVDFGETCGSGRALVGLVGTSGGQLLGLTSVQGRCAVLELAGRAPPRVVTTTESTLSLHGEANEQHHLASCPPDHAIVALAAATGSWIDQIVLSCAPVLIDASAGVPTVTLGPEISVPPLGPPSGGPVAASRCLPGKIAVGLHGAAGRAVDRVGLDCARPVLP
jgi:hypothetical protein